MNTRKGQTIMHDNEGKDRRQKGPYKGRSEWSKAIASDKRLAAYFHAVHDTLDMDELSDEESEEIAQVMSMVQNVAMSGSDTFLGHKYYAPKWESQVRWVKDGIKHADSTAKRMQVVLDREGVENVIVKAGVLSVNPSEDLMVLIDVFAKKLSRFLYRNTCGATWILGIDNEKGKWFVHAHVVCLFHQGAISMGKRKRQSHSFINRWIKNCGQPASLGRQHIRPVNANAHHFKRDGGRLIIDEDNPPVASELIADVEKYLRYSSHGSHDCYGESISPECRVEMLLARCQYLEKTGRIRMPSVMGSTGWLRGV